MACDTGSVALVCMVRYGMSSAMQCGMVQYGTYNAHKHKCYSLFTDHNELHTELSAVMHFIL